MKRPIIEVDEEKCDGCGQCVLDCAEGALAIVDGKARLISDVYCDGLGACLNCPQGALHLVTREAPAFDEEAALAAKAARQDKQDIASCSCPGSQVRTLDTIRPLAQPGQDMQMLRGQAAFKAVLPTWPIQLRLIPPTAPFLKNARLLLAAHCAGFALPNLHQDWLVGHVPLIACPKLDDTQELQARLSAIVRESGAMSLEILRMSVPCCGGLESLVRKAVEECGRALTVSSHVVDLG